MSRRIHGRPSLAALIVSGLLLGAVPAAASPAGGGVRPDVGKPSITTPPNQLSILGSPVSFKGMGAEMVSIKALGLPEGLLASVVSPTEWAVTGTPTKVTPPTMVTVTVESSGGETAEATFEWTVDGINDPGPQTGVAGTAVEVQVSGVGLDELTAAEALPEGLRLERVSETEWKIVGTPAHAGVGEVELAGKNSAKEPLPAVRFSFTIAAAPASPSPPTATGTLSISPAAAFSAAHSSCGGVTYSSGTVTTEWLLDGTPITGATSATYIAPRIDDGQSLSCRQIATAADGASITLTSPGLTIHEQPPQPAWPIGPASEHCAAALCMEDGPSAQTPPTRTYEHGGSWFAASQVRCVSAPWTSIAGGSTLPSVEPFAEAHTVSVTLERVTQAGIVTLAGEQLSALGAPADELDGTLGQSPFAGQIVAGYGPEPFMAGELWPRLEPGSLGRPDRFAAGQGYIAYQLAATPGLRRSFQLVYNLTRADLGARLRCVVAAEDGPVGAPTSATLTSPEYAVANSISCAPRKIAHIGGPQPAVLLIGSRRCLSAQAGLPEIGGSLPDVSSVAGRSVLALECALAGGCSGRLAVASAGHRLAAVAVSLRQGSRRVVELKLDSQGRSRLRRAGRAGLPVTLTLAAGGSSRLLLAARLLNLT